LAISATGAILGPKKATLRGRSSTLRGLRRLLARQAGYELICTPTRPDGRPLHSFGIAVLAGQETTASHPRSFGSQLNGSAESVGFRAQAIEPEGKTGGRLSIACRSPAVGWEGNARWIPPGMMLAIGCVPVRRIVGRPHRRRTDAPCEIMWSRA
jgi:hypothetical protein